MALFRNFFFLEQPKEDRGIFWSGGFLKSQHLVLILTFFEAYKLVRFACKRNCMAGSQEVLTCMKLSCWNWHVRKLSWNQLNSTLDLIDFKTEFSNEIISVFCSFHGCMRNLTLNGGLVDLQTSLPSGFGNDPPPPLASCPREDQCIVSTMCQFSFLHVLVVGTPVHLPSRLHRSKLHGL